MRDGLRELAEFEIEKELRPFYKARPEAKALAVIKGGRGDEAEE